ncbi:hypothetical protein SMC26_39570 [Actinomadura fulvescens]|uniref:Uncharacterized protein n=1 Tax=Actinomadura fulvescens TaxID=46160 RepID=A0ABN3Q034_9ACTN
MTRVEALEIARKHVESLATNSRGYQDGVKLADKVAAVETFARFLMEGEPDRVEITTLDRRDPEYLAIGGGVPDEPIEHPWLDRRMP